MALVDDGDPVRGVGLVTIYAAYLEEQIDQLLTLLEVLEASARVKVLVASIMQPLAEYSPFAKPLRRRSRVPG